MNEFHEESGARFSSPNNLASRFASVSIASRLVGTQQEALYHCIEKARFTPLYEYELSLPANDIRFV